MDYTTATCFYAKDVIAEFGIANANTLVAPNAVWVYGLTFGQYAQKYPDVILNKQAYNDALSPFLDVAPDISTLQQECGTIPGCTPCTPIPLCTFGNRTNPWNYDDCAQVDVAPCACNNFFWSGKPTTLTQGVDGTWYCCNDRSGND
jgi:hypothetical protein